MSTAALRTATADDLRAFYGALPRGRTVAVAGTVDGALVGIGGWTWVDGRAIAFCHIHEPGTACRKTIHRAGRRVVALAKAYNTDLYAMTDPNKPGAPRWLERLGFVRLKEDEAGMHVYMLEGADG